jgi:hypothetical protein
MSRGFFVVSNVGQASSLPADGKAGGKKPLKRKMGRLEALPYFENIL